MNLNESLVDEMVRLEYSREDAVVFVRAKGKCEYCGVDLIHNRIAWDSVQFDHIIPKSKGGSDKTDNLALSCKICNNAKMTFYPQGVTREELLLSAKAHISERRGHADDFYMKVSKIFNEHGYSSENST